MIQSTFPESIGQEARARLISYKYLRDVFAHSGTVISHSLHEVKKASEAASTLPGVVFHRFNQSEPEGALLKKNAKFTGQIELTEEFLPEAISLFRSTFDQIALISSRDG